MYFRLALVCLGIVAIAWASTAKEPPPVPKQEDTKKDVKPPDGKKAPDGKEAGSTVVANEVPVDPIKAAQKTLADAKIATDPKALLEFFRSRTLSDDDRARLLNTIRRLGDDDFDVREGASESLMKAGLAALPILRAASRDTNVEIARRVDLCLRAKGDAHITPDAEQNNLVATVQQASSTIL